MIFDKYWVTKVYYYLIAFHVNQKVILMCQSRQKYKIKKNKNKNYQNSTYTWNSMVLSRKLILFMWCLIKISFYLFSISFFKICLQQLFAVVVLRIICIKTNNAWACRCHSPNRPTFVTTTAIYYNRDQRIACFTPNSLDLKNFLFQVWPIKQLIHAFYILYIFLNSNQTLTIV